VESKNIIDLVFWVSLAAISLTLLVFPDGAVRVLSFGTRRSEDIGPLLLTAARVSALVAALGCLLLLIPYLRK